MKRETLQTPRLSIVPQTVDEVRAMIATMSAADRAEVSPVWLALLDDPAVSGWTLGFSLQERESGAAIGTAGFKGPPTDGMAELAYGIDPEFQGRGFATEAAEALTAWALNDGDVRVVRAHTLPEPNASTRVLKKCGFRFLGEVHDPEDGKVWRWEREKGASLDCHPERSEGSSGAPDSSRRSE